MILKTLSIINYKNIKEATLTLSPKINCLIGSNGMGKTNILDTVYFLSFCKSHTSTTDSQIIRHDNDFYVVEGTYEDESGNEEVIYCGMKRGTKKHFKSSKQRDLSALESIEVILFVFLNYSL